MFNFPIPAIIPYRFFIIIFFCFGLIFSAGAYSNKFINRAGAGSEPFLGSQQRKQPFESPSWFITTQTGMSTNRAVAETVASGIPYTILPVRAFYGRIGAGVLLRRHFLVELSLSRFLAGTSLTVPNTVPQVPEFPLLIESKHRILSTQLSLGYRLQYQRFSFTPTLGIGRSRLPAQSTFFTGNVMVNGAYRVDVQVTTTLWGRSDWNLQLNAPLGYTFSMKGNRSLTVGYAPGMVRNRRNMISTAALISNGTNQYQLLTSNKANIISHALYVTWSFNRTD